MSAPTHLLYLHGFRSSPQSFKAQRLGRVVQALQAQGQALIPFSEAFAPVDVIAFVGQGRLDHRGDGAIVFETTAEIIVADGALGGKEGKARLRAVLTQASLDAEEAFTNQKEQINKEGEQKRADLKALAEGEIAGLRANAKTSAQSRKEEIAKEKKALLSLKAFQLLPEIGREDELDSFRTLDAKFGSERPRGARIFRAGMGAEALRELIERMDLDAGAEQCSGQRIELRHCQLPRAARRCRVADADAAALGPVGREDAHLVALHDQVVAGDVDPGHDRFLHVLGQVGDQWHQGAQPFRCSHLDSF